MVLDSRAVSPATPIVTSRNAGHMLPNLTRCYGKNYVTSRQNSRSDFVMIHTFCMLLRARGDKVIISAICVNNQYVGDKLQTDVYA